VNYASLYRDASSHGQGKATVICYMTDNGFTRLKKCHLHFPNGKKHASGLLPAQWYNLKHIMNTRTERIGAWDVLASLFLNACCLVMDEGLVVITVASEELFCRELDGCHMDEQAVRCFATTMSSLNSVHYHVMMSCLHTGQCLFVWSHGSTQAL